MARYLSLQPSELCFEYNEYGRPEIQVTEGSIEGNQRLRFNLSHTRGMAVCAVTFHYDIGVDIESCTRNLDALDIAKNFFSPQEYEVLATLPEAQLQKRFIEYWVLKEAYTKARGLGLSLALDRFSFQLQKNRILFTDKQDGHEHAPEQNQNWQFYLLQLQDTFKIAIAINASQKNPCEIQSMKVVPLLAEEKIRLV